jgi:hypothetical protein
VRLTLVPPAVQLADAQAAHAQHAAEPGHVRRLEHRDHFHSNFTATLVNVAGGMYAYRRTVPSAELVFFDSTTPSIGIAYATVTPASTNRSTRSGLGEENIYSSGRYFSG